MRNAFLGYTYQEHVAVLFLTKMDVERNIELIDIEVDVNNNFDDIKIVSENVEYYFQIKDVINISLENLILTNNTIKINGKVHKLSEKINILFFRNINISPNCEMLGFPAFKLDEVYIISLGHLEIENKINELHANNFHRKSVIDRYFSECLDKRTLTILRENLPTINVFSTKLLEPTIDVGKKHLEFENIIVIEGKPGVGKSHFVNCLEKEFDNNLLYRFWISSQDKDSEKRLKYKNFISDFSKKLFDDQLHRDENEIIKKIETEKKTVIIDGLDHIENYNSQELEMYIEFIDNLKDTCKTIILTRPLQKKLKWKEYLLGDWNEKQTEKVLDELYHISDYKITHKIYSITNGYPILVKYIAEYYKKNNDIPKLNKLESIDSYYKQIIGTGKQGLFLFLCSRSFFMKSEIEMLLENELSTFVNEVIKEHPYLFEIRLNRISLFHDSFNTYLRKQDINYTKRKDKLNKYVFDSIMRMEKRFLSRFGFLDLDIEMKRKIIKQYSSIDLFKKLFSDVIDFESIQSFYVQLREALNEISPNDLEIINYYDLSLIINSVLRDHVSTINTFLYTYVKGLLFNGYSEEDCTSTKYLFAMLYYVKTDDASLLLNITSNDYYDTERFYEDLSFDKQEEDPYFKMHEKPLSKEQIKKLIENKTEVETTKSISYILENLYIYDNCRSDFSELFECIYKYIHTDEEEAILILKSLLNQYNARSFFASMVLKDSKRNILAIGKASEINDYLNLTLKDYIIKYKDLGSFDFWVEMLNYIRLSLHNNNKIDISSISMFWTKYHQRKDYSLYSIDTALKVFEEKGYVSLLDSCELIKSIQEISEKGYRGLLSSFIQQYSPDIIFFLIENFNVEDLRISWFDLPAKYIDKFPEDLFNYALNEVLRQNQYNKQINYGDIANVIDSKWAQELKEILVLIKYKIRVSNLNKDIKRTIYEDVEILEYTEDENIIKSKSPERYNQGILTSIDEEFIIKNNLKSFELAGFSDENYDALADLDVFSLFEKENIKENINLILYNALLGKIRSINLFNSLYHFPGNVPKLINDYGEETDIKKLFNSFLVYLDLSMFTKLNKRRGKI